MNNNNSNIEFEVKDFLSSDMRYFDKKAKNLAYMVYNNPTLLKVLKEFLLTFIDKIDFKNKYKRWRKDILEFQLLYGQAVLENFLKELHDSYNVVKPQHLDKFRGLVFEYLMEIHYKKIYSNKGDQACFGCKITINGNEIVYNCLEDQDKSRKTVDIVGYNKVNSVFYEIKVGPKGFDSHVIKYLNILNQELKKNKISKNITVGCMTLKKISSLKMILIANKVKFDELQLNGFEEVKKIICE